MSVVKATSSDIALLARLLRAEGEGIKGVLLVGNVGINRVRANCSDFKGLRTTPQMIYQPHAFEAVMHRYTKVVLKRIINIFTSFSRWFIKTKRRKQRFFLKSCFLCLNIYMLSWYSG